MFDWLKQITGGGETGVPKMSGDLLLMIQEGRHAFEAACSALLDGADPASVREDLMATDARIDALEQGIRRQILVHGSVHGAGNLPELMVLMSVSKDAERIGDYAKNLLALTKVRDVTRGKPHHDELQALRRDVSTLLADAPAVFKAHDEERANEFITRAQEAVDACERHMLAIFETEQCSGHDAACAMAYRYVRRVAGHVQNVITAVVNPVDMLDFADEPNVPEFE